MEIIGHRGLAISHVENTIGSFEDAFKNGANAIELDVHLSEDHVPVVFHDFDLNRLAHIPSKIYELSLSEIKNISLGEKQDRIPTLDEVINKFYNKKIYIELKTIDDNGKRYNESLPEILFKKYGKSSNLVFISFDPKSLEELRSYSSDIPLGLDFEENSEKILPLNFLKKFMLNNKIEYFIPDIKSFSRYIGILDNEFKNVPWVVNDISIVKEYLNNISGVITDRCDIISKQIK